MIKLSKSDYEKILHHAESELPNEACGLIGGVKEGSDKIIKKVYLLTNVGHSNENFSLDPKGRLAALTVAGAGYCSKRVRAHWHGA